MARKRVSVWLFLLDKILPLILLMGFLPFLGYYFSRGPGDFLTACTTVALIALGIESLFTGIGDRIREWHQQRGQLPHDLDILFETGVAKFRELVAAIRSEDPDPKAIDGVIEDIEDTCRSMRPGIDLRLKTRSSLWSAPVYGLSTVVSMSLLDAKLPMFFHLPWYVRGLCYAPIIWAWEYCWGRTLEKINIQAWEYARSLIRWKRLIRLEYGGFWFILGLCLEWTHHKLVPLIVSTFSVLPHH